MKNRNLPALLSAFLLWLGWPPVPYTAPVLLVALVPLLVAVDDILRSDVRGKGKKVFGTTFLCFVIWNTASVYWVFNSLHSIMPWFVALLISLIPFSLAPALMALAFRLYAAVRVRVKPFYAYCALLSFWIGYEYLNQTWDLAFPWMNLGNGFAAMPALVQWYSFTGVFGGTLWILVSNLLIFEGYRHFRTRTRGLTPVFRAAMAVVVLPIVASTIMYATYTERPDPANVVVVQPNIDPYGKFGSVPPSDQVAVLTRLSDSVAQKNTEFFIWPETAIAAQAEERRIRENPLFLQAQQFLRPYKNGNIISGIESYSLYDSARTASAMLRPDVNLYLDVFNAGVLIENSARVQFYHKSKLVPGVEQTPFAGALSFMKPLFAQFGGSTGSYGAQQDPSVLYAASGIGAAPVICYESIWGDWVAGGVKRGAQFIAIMTNDGWWGNTSGKDQHFDYARLRAIETRRWVVRSANTGISGFINQRGDIVSKSKWWTATALKADINLNEELTFYVRNGDLIALAGCFGSGVFLAMLLVSGVRRRLTAQRSAP